jgi:hypothetical protein
MLFEIWPIISISPPSPTAPTPSIPEVSDRYEVEAAFPKSWPIKASACIKPGVIKKRCASEVLTFDEQLKGAESYFVGAGNTDEYLKRCRRGMAEWERKAAAFAFHALVPGDTRALIIDTGRRAPDAGREQFTISHTIHGFIYMYHNVPYRAALNERAWITKDCRIKYKIDED